MILKAKYFAFTIIFSYKLPYKYMCFPMRLHICLYGFLFEEIVKNIDKYSADVYIVNVKKYPVGVYKKEL